MQTETRITVAAPVDIVAVASLILRQFEEHAIEVEQPSITAAIDRVLARPDLGLILTAHHRGQTVGVAYVAFTWSLEHCGKSAWLEELYVIPEARDQGVGGALLEAVLAHSRQQGCAAMDLEVDRDHARAENLYRREGFRSLQRARWVRSLVAEG